MLHRSGHLIEVKFTVNKGTNYSEFDNCPLNRRWPYDSGLLAEFNQAQFNQWLNSISNKKNWQKKKNKEMKDGPTKQSKNKRNQTKPKFFSPWFEKNHFNTCAALSFEAFSLCKSVSCLEICNKPKQWELVISKTPDPVGNNSIHNTNHWPLENSKDSIINQTEEIKTI